MLYRCRTGSTCGTRYWSPRRNLGAQRRTESRGAHQRDDYPRTDPEQAFNFVTVLKDGALSLEPTPIVKKSYELMPLEAAE